MEDYIRIPVSLRFNDDTFFRMFIVPLREERKLSSFIVDLLRLYYENQVVQEEYRKLTSAGIIDILTRIKEEHELDLKVFNSLDFSLISKEKAIEKVLYAKSRYKNQQEEVNKEGVRVERKEGSSDVEVLENRIQQIENTLTELKSMMQKFLNENVTEKSVKEHNNQNELVDESEGISLDSLIASIESKKTEEVKYHVQDSSMKLVEDNKQEVNKHEGVESVKSEESADTWSKTENLVINDGDNVNDQHQILENDKTEDVISIPAYLQDFIDDAESISYDSNKNLTANLTEPVLTKQEESINQENKEEKEITAPASFSKMLKSLKK